MENFGIRNLCEDKMDESRFNISHDTAVMISRYVLKDKMPVLEAAANANDFAYLWRNGGPWLTGT